MGYEISEQEIRERAYDLWEYRKEFDIDGSALDDWFDARRELIARLNSNSIDHINAFRIYYIKGGY